MAKKDISYVIYTGNFRLFPADAAGRRVLALAEALRSAGRIVYLCPRLGWTPTGIVKFVDEFDYDRQIVKGVRFSLRRLLRELMAPSVGAVILYNPSNFLALVLNAVAGIRGMVAALDLTEWYEYAHLPSFQAKAEVFVRMNFTYRLFSRMIFISEYLASCYDPIIGRVIPPLVPKELLIESAPISGHQGALKILYAGFPGKKDRIDLLVKWLSQANLPFPVQLILAGPRPDQVPDFDAVEGKFTVTALGPVERKKVFELYNKCHLSAIIRDDARYEWAGFPTKSVESWSHGVPVLAMSHSKFAKTASEYGAAAIIEASNPIASIERILRDIFLKESRLNEMSVAALRLARDHHQISLHISNIEAVIS